MPSLPVITVTSRGSNACLMQAIFTPRFLSPALRCTATSTGDKSGKRFAQILSSNLNSALPCKSLLLISAK